MEDEINNIFGFERINGDAFIYRPKFGSKKEIIHGQN